MPIDTSTATMQELQAEFLRLAGVVTVAANERHAIAQEIDRRVKDIRARERIGRLSDEDKAALRIALNSS
jgi:hypothetical protein